MRRTWTEAPPVTGGDPAVVDTDVGAAVGRVLHDILRERLAAAVAIDAGFARGVGERVARFTLDGGKRMRSRFLWWGLRACGGPADTECTEAALRLGAGLELIQTCALVHDDVMDGSSVRRGRPAVHVDLAAQYRARPDGPGATFGTGAAILVGDLALAWADDIVATTRMPAGTAEHVRGLWQAMRSEMVAGQFLDLYGQRTGSRSMPLAVKTATLKSALYSVERPLALGAALAGADQRTTRAICSAGRCAGIAFQLRDDLLGVFGDPGHTGKPSGDDIREGKVTYLLTVARARAEATGNRALLQILDTHVGGGAALTEEDLERVRGALEASGARDLVETKIRRLLAQSVRHLDRVAFAHPAAAHLREMFCTAAGLRAVPAPEAPAGTSPAYDGGRTSGPVHPFVEASRR
ncbi:geranylgeranyl pyrophosphate synthase [Streptomyces longisporoflavus]|uniref:polyprenyl synthetase family protein n=1 Tax=Streptomyces longisporoflavus TaxID=28044 RepID=UPI00167DDE0B|nr:polyprenyl synthetase family protein [Streptomyces longisporoflavus]GGV24468.1 geranylgeranyl pyrophosphate synthase [Streptomyces longisporoflavus]